MSATFDPAMLQQCIHCGLCLPTCPTYDATKQERSSPRGRIALMAGVARGELEATRVFGEEMYFCLGCLACETACPAGVEYGALIETGRAVAEEAGVLARPGRSFWRAFLLRGVFRRPRVLRWVGRVLRWYQRSGVQALVRGSGVLFLLPRKWRGWEGQMPRVEARFSDELIAPVELAEGVRKYRVGLLTGCVQDLIYASVNRDTADVLRANGCEVVTPAVQACCGSLLAHNGDLSTAAELARRNIDSFDLDSLDAMITNAGGCGSHLKHYDRLLADDPVYAERARVWSAKVRDVQEWLCEIGVRAPAAGVSQTVTYHESCHLCHGQKISREPRELLRAIPGLRLVELAEAQWCCGSAGIYNFTQPEFSARLLERKIGHLRETGAAIVATANPGCLLQLVNGAREAGLTIRVAHPVTLLAEAYRGGSGSPAR